MKDAKVKQLPKRRILCIDGGGILGTFPAALLAGLEQNLNGRPIGLYFDLIAGTSTGGIIAIGLAMGLRASDILRLYETRGPEIFGQDRGLIIDFLIDKLRFVRRFGINKYSTEPLRNILEETFGNKRIGDAITRLLIPAWNPDARSVYVFKTAHHPRLSNDYKSSAIDAALATAAAPTYFERHITQQAVGLTDGGTWANNPTGLAVVEATAMLDWPGESLRVLSLGCLEETYSIPKRAGIGTLGSKAIKLYMDGQSRSAMGIAKLLTGHEHKRRAVYRIDETIQRNVYKMDDTSVIQSLKGLGYTKAREQQSVLDPVFFSQPAEAFAPVYVLDQEPERLTIFERVST